MNCNQVEIIMAAGRVMVLLLGMCAGTFSIYLGWKLCTQQLKDAAVGSLSIKDIKVALKASPGVFLAAFGCFAVYTIVTQKVDLSEQQTLPSASSTFDRASPAIISSGQFIKVNEQCVSPSPPPCLIVRTRIRRLYDGDLPPLSAADVDAALVHAVDVLQQSRQQARSTQEIAKLRATVGALEALREGLVR